ncbi:hypothetical protein Hdeb2414_s0014g00426101 [Helianthus debilis subsp. tardiflorus]
MVPDSPPLRDAKAVIEDNIPVLSADEIVQWKRMHENPTRAFTFPEGILSVGGLSPFYPVRPKAFLGKKEMTLWGLLQGDCKDVKFMVGDKVEPGMSRGVERKVPEGFVQAGDSVAGEKDEGASSSEEEAPPGSLQVKGSSDGDDDEDLEIRLIRKRKAAQASSPKQVPAPRNIRLRLRSVSGQKAFPAMKATSELPPTRVKGSLSKHLRSSSLVSEPLLGSSNAPIEIPTAPSSSRVRDKTPKISAARITPAFEVSPLHATTTNKSSHLEGFVSQSPLAPLFADALPVPYIPRWKITQSTVVGTLETAWDFFAHVVPPSHRSWCHVRVEGTCLGKGDGGLVEEKEDLAGELKRQKELDSVYRAYRDVGYQAGLKDGYAYFAQGLGSKETPLYNFKAKKHLSKLDKEFGGKTTALLEKILERPLMSIDELKALLAPAGPSSPLCLWMIPSNYKIVTTSIWL